MQAELHPEDLQTGAPAESAANPCKSARGISLSQDWKRYRASFTPLCKRLKRAWGWATRVAKRRAEGDVPVQKNRSHRPRLPLGDLESQLNAQTESSKALEATVRRGAVMYSL